MQIDLARQRFNPEGKGQLDVVSDAGEAISLKTATVELSTTGGAGTVTATNLIPANSLVLAVVTRVTRVIVGAGAASFAIGDGTDADRWGTGIAFALGTTSKTNTTAGGAAFYVSATSVVLTANAGQFDSGAIRITVFYWSLTAPQG